MGLAVHQAARVASAAHGGQILLSGATVAAAAEALPSGASTRELGRFQLKDFDPAARLYQLCHDGLAGEFPPLRARPAVVGNLPTPLSSFIGRQRELTQVEELVGRFRLVTLTGSGGCGKTRLALQVAARIAGGYADGVWFVDLAPVADHQLVASSVAVALGIQQHPRADRSSTPLPPTLPTATSWSCSTTANT